jgi:hypothetical protein
MHDLLQQAGEERVAAFEHEAPRCRWCQIRPGFRVLDGLCTPCRVMWASSRNAAAPSPRAAGEGAASEGE